MNNEEKILQILSELTNTVTQIQSDVSEIKSDLKEVKQKVTAINDQTADFTEFRTETKDKLLKISDSVDFVKHKGQQPKEELYTIKNPFLM